MNWTDQVKQEGGSFLSDGVIRLPARSLPWVWGQWHKLGISKLVLLLLGPHIPSDITILLLLILQLEMM